MKGVESRAKKLAAASTPKSFAGAEVLPGMGRSGRKADDIDEEAEESDPEGRGRPAGPCEAEGIGKGSAILQKQERKDKTLVHEPWRSACKAIDQCSFHR